MNAITQLSSKFRQSALGRWFYGREPYEQQVITGIVIVVILALLWAFMWKPVADWQAVEHNRYQNAHKLLDWLKSNETTLKANARARGSSSSKPLVPIITRAAAEQGINLNRLQPDSNNVVSVVLQAQSFNQIMTWLAQLEENNGVSVERANFDEQSQPGYVNANLRLN